MSEKGKKRGKSSGLGLAIWILAFVIVIIVFLVKWDDIKSNLVKTRFFERLFGKTPSFLVDENSENKKDDDSENVIVLTKSDDKRAEKITKKAEPQESKKEIKSQENQKNEQKISEKKSESQKLETKKSEQKKNPENSQRKSDDSELENKNPSNQIKIVEESNVDTTSRESVSKKSDEKSSEVTKKLETKAEEKAEEKKSSENKKTEAKTVVQNEKPATIAAKICFVAIDSDGTVIRKIVSRQVAKDSPLTESLNSLLSGPNSLESKTGCRTLIPSGTKLYSAVVKNGTATLDFSTEFEINTNGVQGFLGQLMQIVYTATNFSTVQNVQILIEGEKKEYLGSEGVWIGSPLSRASFR